MEKHDFEQSGLSDKMTFQEFTEAYNSLYDEFGVLVTLWSQEELESKITNYYIDRNEES